MMVSISTMVDLTEGPSLVKNRLAQRNLDYPNITKSCLLNFTTIPTTYDTR